MGSEMCIRDSIVTAPADDYVADFVAGISRLKLVSAAKIMVEIDKHIAQFGNLPKDCPSAQPDDDLDTLIGLSTGTDLPVIIKADDKAIGVVSKDTLLRGLQGGERI